MSKEELKKYLDNENVQYFLYQIFKGESDKDDGVVNLAGFNQSGPDPKNNYYSSSAFGSQQFTGVTRNDVLEKYGIDAWSKDVNEQQMATLALLSMDNTLEDVSKGNYKSTIEKGRWEAFTKRPTLLTGDKPDGWKTKYSNLKDNAVYDPKKSWDKIPDKNKIGKIKLFNGKTYGPIMEELGLSDTINSNIGKAQLDQIVNLSNKQTYDSSVNLSLSKEEQTASNIVGDAKKLIEIHDATINVKTDVEDVNAFRSTVDGISKSFANDLKEGRFKGDDDDARSEYFKRISNAFGWSDINQLDPEQLGVARGQVEEFFQYTKGSSYGEKIGGDQYWDSLFEDMTEDKYYTSLELSKEVGIPFAGHAPSEVYAELGGNPITRGMTKGGYVEGYDRRELVYDESAFDSYLASKAPRLREQISTGENTLDEVVDYLSENQSETFIIQDSDENAISQSIVDSDLFPETTALLDDPEVDEDADVEDDFEIEEIDIRLAPELDKDEDLSFEDWKIRYPDGTQEEYDNRGTTGEVDEEDSGYQNWLKDNPGGTREEYKKYFDLRGDTSGLGKESFLDKIGGLSSLIGLATGAMGLGEALKDVDIPKDPKLGPAFQQRLEESKRLAQQGLTPSELAKAHNDLDSSYATGIENIVRGSAGNRAQFLAGLGGLDVARQSALMDIAVADAQMQRQNQEKYDKMMMVNEQYEAARTSKYDQAKFEQDMATKSAGAALAGSALSMVNENIGNRQLNRYNKMKTEKLMRDMGYRNDSNGNSTEKQMGVDPKTGKKVQTSFTLPGDDNYVAPNLLNADEQVTTTKVENTGKPNQITSLPQIQQPNTTLVSGLYSNDDSFYTGGVRSSGLISNTDTQVNLDHNLYDIFNKR